MDRDAAFAAAKKKRAQEKVDEENKRNGNWTEYERTEYSALELNEYRIFRILGGPHQMRQDPTDCKLIEQSKIRGDDGKNFICTWPTKEEDKNWFLRRVYEKVTEGTWAKNESGKNVKTYTHMSKHPALLNRVLYNDNPDNQYESGWRPGKAILMNHIDRHDMEFHETEKKSKVLSKKKSVYGDNNEKVYYDRGVPPTVYNAIWDEIVEYEGNWENYDVVVKKVKDQPYYKVWYGGSDDLRKKLSQDAPELLDILSTKPLQPWEKELELYNFDEIGKVTNYTKISDKLGSFISAVDSALGTKFTDELKALKAEEDEAKAEKAKQEAMEEANEVSSKPAKVEEPEEVAENDAPVEEEAPVEEAKPQRSARPTREAKVETPSIDWEGLADGSFNGTVYKGVPNMTDDEKAQVISVKDDGSFEYVKEWEGEEIELFEESKTKFESPGTFHVCPLTGLEFS